MGVPKFFRWLSERYPAISQLISENRIPEFDALYLDMNGIIHNCTHKDTDAPGFRLTEDKMFIAIFNYIEHLFGKIKPKKLFYMAIDGVAPRAKMNQQRARRFRTALDAEKARDKAIKEGVELPKEDPFDSNCITPGTEFMARLTQQLKYFISKKVTEDIEWQGVEVVLSGHEVPGEGEHKIMEYIRQAKAQPGYDPNVRHCLYGLDADLIMLGLLSHDPHFCLLREEVSFGRQTKKTKELEQQNFFLLHLCIVREYLELEFQELERSNLGFKYDMERIIDDFILMAFFVGNDFLPNLPNLHINEGALALMFQKYKEVLPKMGGYMNEYGVINTQRLALLLDELSEVEHRFFEAEMGDRKWINAKKVALEAPEKKEEEEQNEKTPTVITKAQKDLFNQVKAYVSDIDNQLNSTPKDFHGVPAGDRKFLETLAKKLYLRWSSPADANGDRFLRLEFPPVKDDDDDEEEEAVTAQHRVLKQYARAKVEDTSAADTQKKALEKYDAEFLNWKNRYYQEKFQHTSQDVEPMRELTENYVQGLQWVLFYYYRGVASWPWYYRYHYSPMISDVKQGLNANMKFELGQPFHPYEQLMGVLPDRSKKIVPEVYHDLMTNPNSPIIDFYPRDFELDMNGKKMEWEAVVVIPFIDEKRLLAAMAPKNALLSPAEKKRNDFGVSLKFSYSAEQDETYTSPIPGIFPDINHCKCVMNIFELPVMDGLHPHIGLMPGVKLGASALAGFPTLKTLPFTGSLGFHGVNVFQQDSRNESMIVTLSDNETRSKVAYAKTLLGKRVFVNYPFLQEAKVVKVADELFDYSLDPAGHVGQQERTGRELDDFYKRSEAIEKFYSKRLGMLTHSVEALVYIEMLKGLQKLDDGSTVKEFAHQPNMQEVYASQVIVENVISPDERFIEHAALPVEQEFPDGSNAFFLGDYAYGQPVSVVGHTGGKVKCLVVTSNSPQIEFGREIVKRAEAEDKYIPSFNCVKILAMHPLALAKITSAFMIKVGEDKVNLGLNLKFEAKKLKVLGYSRKGASGWEFSQQAIDLIREYKNKFPTFFAAISRNPQGDMLPATELFGGSEEQAKAKVREVQAWLKLGESKNFERVPLDAAQLDSDIVMQIELAADYALQQEQQPTIKPMNGIPRNALLKPADAQWRLGHQQFQLGDRVIYVADSGKVPIASKGTVVGLTQTTREIWLDVVFDVSFMSGSSLGDRCNAFRGQTVPTWSVLNLSSRQTSAQSKASQQRNAQNGSAPTPLTVNGYGASGQAQYREVAPPPALRGGYRGAVAGGRGQPRGGFVPRGGRGGANGVNGTNGTTNLPFRPQQNGQENVNGQGYTPIDRGDADPNLLRVNPNFRPKQHHNVPPPAVLDQPLPPRGRGRGRGGVNRGRGRGAAATNGTA